MARRKLEKRHIRKIQRSHGTYTVSIPISDMRALKWREHQKVTVRRFGKGLRVQDWKPGR